MTELRAPRGADARAPTFPPPPGDGHTAHDALHRAVSEGEWSDAVVIIQQYGDERAQEAREAAIEEAAHLCERVAAVGSPDRASARLRLGKAIRGLAANPGAVDG